MLARFFNFALEVYWRFIGRLVGRLSADMIIVARINSMSINLLIDSVGVFVIGDMYDLIVMKY